MAADPSRRTASTEPTTRPETRLRRSPQYKVLLHNDDVTPMDFVVHLLMRVFGLASQRAMAIMMLAHHTGVGLVGLYPLEQAEFRVERAHSLARTNKFPLTFSYEPE